VAAGVYNGTVTVTDKDGGVSTQGTFKVTVNTPPALLTSLSPIAIDEGSLATVTGTFSDPDVDALGSPSDTHKITIVWGDSSPNTIINLAKGVTTIPSTTHKYLDDNPPATPYALKLTVTDSANAAVSDNTTVTVRNVAPQIAATTGSNITLPLWIDFSDAGTLDTHTCTVNWGDGLTTPGTVADSNGRGNCTASHSYSGSGTYTIGVTITDNGGASANTNYQYIKP